MYNPPPTGEIAPVSYDDLDALVFRLRAAWAAWSISAIEPLYPPEFASGFPFSRCVRTAWDVALGRPFDRDEFAVLNERMALEGEVLGQTEDPLGPDHPGWWLLGTDCQHCHVAAPGHLSELVLRAPERASSFAVSAVESASRVYACFQQWRQGFENVSSAAYDYHEYLAEVFHGMTRLAYERAAYWAGDPAENMFDGIAFPWDVELLEPRLAERSRREWPTPPGIASWLRERDWWLGPA